MIREKLLLGFNARNKTLIVLGYVLILLIPIAEAQALSWEIFGSMIGSITCSGFSRSLFACSNGLCYETVT